MILKIAQDIKSEPAVPQGKAGSGTPGSFILFAVISRDPISVAVVSGMTAVYPIFEVCFRYGQAGTLPVQINDLYVFHT